MKIRSSFFLTVLVFISLYALYQLFLSSIDLVNFKASMYSDYISNQPHLEGFIDALVIMLVVGIVVNYFYRKETALIEVLIKGIVFCLVMIPAITFCILPIADYVKDYNLIKSSIAFYFSLGSFWFVFTILLLQVVNIIKYPTKN